MSSNTIASDTVSLGAFSTLKGKEKVAFKETITNTFLKTVSAFSNYDGGEIFFGIDDNVKVSIWIYSFNFLHSVSKVSSWSSHGNSSNLIFFPSIKKYDWFSAYF
mgnify:CR=1 FL=1